MGRSTPLTSLWSACLFICLCVWPLDSTRETASQLRLQSLLHHLGSSVRSPTELNNSSITEKHLSWSLDFNTGLASPSLPVGPLRDAPRPTVRSYQEFYKMFFGSAEDVNYLKKNYGPTGLQQARAAYDVTQELNDVRQANEHFLRIRKHAKCRWPRSKVMRVKDYYPDPSKEYMPRCTILHRCGEDSGCCDNEGFECVPRAVQEVSLHFYTLYIGTQSIGLSNSVERLLFVNHTECECQPINDLPRIQEEPRQHSVHLPHQKPDYRQTKCRECPVPFSRREYEDGRCSCDCFDRQRPCLRIKRGREPLSEIERRCVEASHCHVPDCEYGYYDVRTGRCPKKPDELQNRSTHRPYHNSHRWSFFERD